MLAKKIFMLPAERSGVWARGYWSTTDWGVGWGDPLGRSDGRETRCPTRPVWRGVGGPRLPPREVLCHFTRAWAAWPHGVLLCWWRVMVLVSPSVIPGLRNAGILGFHLPGSARLRCHAPLSLGLWGRVSPFLWVYASWNPGYLDSKSQGL